MAEDIPDEWAQAVSHELTDLNRSRSDLALALIATLYPLVAARVRADTANQIAGAIEALGSPCPVDQDVHGLCRVGKAVGIARVFGGSS